MKDWLTIAEAAYVVNRHQSRVYRWIDQGVIATRRNLKGTIEVLARDVLKVESVTKPGRPRRVDHKM